MAHQDTSRIKDARALSMVVLSTRRDFLGQCAALAAAAGLPALGALARPSAFVMKDIPLNALSYATLAAQVNTTFQVHAAPGRTVKLELISASLFPEAGGRGGAQDYERFSLVFRGALAEPLEQKIHRFEHQQIGRFEMFIVPVVSRDAGNAYYEAIFNRLRPAEA